MAEITIRSTTETPEAIAAAMALANGETKSAEQVVADQQAEAAKADATAVVASPPDPEAEAALIEARKNKGDSSRGKDAESRIKELLGQNRVEKALREADQQTIRALQGRLAALETRVENPPVPPPPEPPEPKIDDFPTLDAYIAALTEYKAEKKVREALGQVDNKIEERLTRTKQEEAAKTEEQRQREVFDNHAARVEAFRAKHEDYDEVVLQISQADIPVPALLSTHIMNSELGPELLYYFAHHPDELVALCKKNQGPMLVAVGKLEAKLEAGMTTAPTPSKKETPPPTPPRNTLAGVVTKVGRPPSPPPSASAGSSTPTLAAPGQSFSDFKRMRDEELVAKGKPRTSW